MISALFNADVQSNYRREKGYLEKDVRIGASKMAQWVEVLATKPNDLSSSPEEKINSTFIL